MIRVCYPFIGTSIGGSHISTLMLLERLDRRRFEPVIVLHEEGPLADHLRARDVSYTLVPLPTYAGSYPSLAGVGIAMVRVLPILLRFLQDHSIDIVHANDLRCNLSWSPAARLVARHVWHQRSALSGSRLWSLIRVLADRVICISDAVRATLPAGMQARARVITNPFRLSPFLSERAVSRASVVRELKLDPDCLLVGMVGRLVAGKAPATFVRAAASVVRRIAGPIAFLCAGEGEAQASLMNLAADMGLKGRIHFIGFRYPVEPVLAALDVLVAPSRDEGFGRALVEAMLVGTPVVASDIPAHREVAGSEEAVRLVSPDDAEAFANAIMGLLADKAGAQLLAERAFMRAKSVYCGHAHADLVMRVYESVLTRSPGLSGS